jgi:hypothetical protein
MFCIVSEPNDQGPAQLFSLIGASLLHTGLDGGSTPKTLGFNIYLDALKSLVWLK